MDVKAKRERARKAAQTRAAHARADNREVIRQIQLLNDEAAERRDLARRMAEHAANPPEHDRLFAEAMIHRSLGSVSKVAPLRMWHEQMEALLTEAAHCASFLAHTKGDASTDGKRKRADNAARLKALKSEIAHLRKERA